MTYAWHWNDGATDCEPPEPDKLWIGIVDGECEEICTLILRKIDGYEKLMEAKEDWASRICAALNWIHQKEHVRKGKDNGTTTNSN